MHCSVECLDPTVGSETPLQKSATISSPSENDSIKHKKAFVRKIVEEELRKKGIDPDKYLVGDVLM